MEHFVTLFDCFFLPQGLNLYESLKRHAGSFTLWIICVDDLTYNILEELNIDNISLIKLSDVETPEIMVAKSNRSHKEYCWTLTPLSVRFVFEANEEVERVTYVDADLFFLRNPKMIYSEFENSNKKILITEHAYAPEFDQSGKTGRFCVQFMIFSRNGGEFVRKWWEERCLEWCYARFEDGKFGDQKYLDDWETLFADDVHILTNKDWSLAPWNASRFPYSSAVFYHFHGLRLLKDGAAICDGYPLPKVLLDNVYKPYVELLKLQIEKLKSIGFIVQPQAKHPGIFRYIYRFFVGVQNQMWRFSKMNSIR